MEASAKNNSNVNLVFTTLVEQIVFKGKEEKPVAQKKEKKGKKKCLIM